MRAVVHDRYGPPEVLRLVDIPKPIPKDDEILVKVHAATVSRTDVALRAGTPFISRCITGVRRPRRRILGSDLAGEVTSVGAAVTGFSVGDHVFGINPWMFGTHAEFMCMQARGPVAQMPAGMSYEDAAAVCDGAILALNAMRPAHLHKGQRLLIYGASGSIGTAATQLARFFGADVTAVCRPNSAGIVRSLGADDVIDSTREDFTKNGRTYDAILDAVGNLTFSACRGSLKSGGVYLATDGLRNVPLSVWTARVGDKRVRFSIPPRFTKQDVVFLRSIIEAGKYRAVIDRRYPLEQVVAATRYVETMGKTGNVVLTIIADGAP
ncbi:MAG: NAD(P)-dependent alcohol dehydrogenase [Candidatus Dormiibacterota bacterium]